MGRGITVTRAFGWVIDHYEGQWVGDLEQFLPKEAIVDVTEWVEPIMKANDLDVKVESFGYEFAGSALVARASAVDSYDFEHKLETFLPDKVKEPQLKRELLQALDVLDWSEAGLGEPSWLLLVTYG